RADRTASRQLRTCAVRSRNRVVASLIAAALLTVGSGAGAAQADPLPVVPPTYLAGVGSDTSQGAMNPLPDISQDVMNAIANSPNTLQMLGSWNAVPPGTINPHPNLNGPAALYPGGNGTSCQLTRPKSPNTGLTYLEASLSFNGSGGDGGLQWARSSVANTAPATVSITFIPFAFEGLDFAITNTSAVPKNVTLTDLRGIYQCNQIYVGQGPNYTITPMLPQAGSGTRSFWEAAMGITDTDVNNNVYPCIINGVKNLQTIEEHSGTLVDDKSLVPFSIPKYLTEVYGTVADLHGRTLLGTLQDAQGNVTYPALFNAGNAAATQWPVILTRELYNVIRTSLVNTAPYSTEFVGPNSLVCQQTAIIQHYGFATDPNCGSTALVAPGAP